MRKLILVVSATLALFSGCLCQPPSYALVDNFSESGDGTTDQLHSYAAGSRVEFTVVKSLFDDAAFSVAFGGAFAPCANCDDDDGGDDEQDTVFDVDVGAAGVGTITITDDDGAVVGEVRELAVKDVDEVALAVTAPGAPDLELPSIDPDNLRIWTDPVAATATKVALRTSLFAGGEEVFGLNVVDATADAVGFSARRCVACAESSCDADRAGIEFAVSATVTDPVDVTVSVGAARLAVTLVPTDGAAVTDVVLDQSGIVDGRQSLIAHVLAGTEPVFGVPVVWSVDGVDVKDADGNAVFGDALQYTSSTTTHGVVARIGGLNADSVVSGDEFSVSAITFACGAAPGATAPVVAVVGLLLLRRRRSR